MKTDLASVVTKEGIYHNNGDICRKRGVRYRDAGGRRLDKPKLNYRFHNENTPEALARVLLRICIDANMDKVESVLKREIAVAVEKAKPQEKEE